MDSDPRAGLDMSGGQAGDIRVGAAAGGDVNYDLDGAELRAFVRDYLWHYDQQTAIYRDEQRRRVAQIQYELWLYRIVLFVAVAYIILAR